MAASVDRAASGRDGRSQYVRDITGCAVRSLYLSVAIARRCRRRTAKGLQMELRASLRRHRLSFSRACLGTLGALVLLTSPAWGTAGYADRLEVREFIGELSRDHGLDATELARILGDARHQASVVRLIGAPPSAPASATASASRPKTCLLYTSPSPRD